MYVPNSKIAIDEPFDETSFDEVEQSNDGYLPFDFVKLVLVPAHNHQFFHEQSKASFEEGDKERKNQVKYKVSDIIFEIRLTERFWFEFRKT